jgi:hypothetical protein
MLSVKQFKTSDPPYAMPHASFPVPQALCNLPPALCLMRYARIFLDHSEFSALFKFRQNEFFQKVFQAIFETWLQFIMDIFKIKLESGGYV